MRPFARGRLTMAGPSINMARNRIASLIAVACAVFGGAAMVTATAAVGETGLTSHLAPDRLAGAEILVTAPQRHLVAEDADIPFPERQTLPASLAADLAAVPGVAGAAADVTFAARLAGTELEGHSWDTAALTGTATPAPGAGEVVLDTETADATGLRSGDLVAVTTAAGTAEYTVSAVADLPGQGLYTDPATALGLAGHGEGQADLIAVDVTSPGDADTAAEAVRSALAGTGYEVVTGDARGDAETLAGGTARSGLLELAIALAATIVLLVGFITGGAISVAVAGQRRDLALLRAVGATPRQVRRLVASQATLVAAAGLIPGIGVGYLLAERFTAFLAGTMPAGLPVALTPVSGLIAAALLLLTVQCAARIAAWRASRLPATAAVTESRVEPRGSGRVRTLIGLLVIAMAITQALMPLVVPGEAAFASAATATLTAVIGLALAGPALVRAVLRLTARRTGAGTGAPAWLAAGNGRAYARRTAGAVAVLALAVGLTVTQVSAQSTFTQTAAAEIADGSRADATVTGAISAADLAALNDASGVDAAVGVIHTDVLRVYEMAGDEEAEPLPALAFSPGIDQVADLDLRDGDLADLTGDTVALDAGTARLWGAEVGDEIRLVLADGTRVDAEVAATYGRGFGFGTVVLAADLVTSRAGPRFYDAALATGDAAAVADWAAGVPGLTAEPGAAVPYIATGMTPDQWLNIMVTLVLCGYVMLGAANSLVAATARRRGEFAGLRAAGATPRQVRAMMRRETLFLCAMAIGAGLAVSVLPMTLLSLVFLGEPWPQGPLWVIPAVAALTALVANAAVAIPTRKALRTPLTTLVAAAE